MATVSVPFIEVVQGDKRIIFTKLPAGIVTKISYAAVRGQSREPEAIQRILNTRRIASIKEFTLRVGYYPNAVILNWTLGANPLRMENGQLLFEDTTNSAQIIDGQHRLAGISAAIQEHPATASLEIPVAIYQHLSIRECADIFLSINTEQKTVPRSLVFDLYGVASEPVIDPAALRARDIALFLNSDENSPYYNGFKLPGSPTRKGGIALSSAVTALKPLVEEKGSFEQIGVIELELQKQILLNFFSAIRSKYQAKWQDRTNAFQYAAGFVGALEFLQLKVIPHCNQLKSFALDTINELIEMEPDDLILQAEIKGVGGKDAPRKIYERLVEIFRPATAQNTEFRI